MELLKSHRGWLSQYIGERFWRRAAISFAKKHHLVYFQQINPENNKIPVIQGTTTASIYTDKNVCIGSHAGYDIVFLERQSMVEFAKYAASHHRWYVLQIDLKRNTYLPFVFVGTRQQSKTYYARLLSSRPGLHYLMLETEAQNSAAFHSHYAIIAELSSLKTVSEIFHNDIVTTMGHHLYPFSIELEKDSLILMTEAKKPNQQLMNKLLHFGLWFAKEVDKTEN